MNQLPRWVEYGAFALALNAGFINGIGLLTLDHQALSHLSGTATLVGTTLANASFTHALSLMLILVSFLGGAALSGLMLSGRSLKSGRHYDSLLLLEALLLGLAMLLLYADYSLGYLLGSAACGLQNALATTYSGAIVRTTHVTGIFTDLGIMLGARARGNAFDKRKARLFLLLISGFICGAVCASLLYVQIGFFALVLPVLLCTVLSAAYRIYIKPSARTAG